MVNIWSLFRKAFTALPPPSKDYLAGRAQFEEGGSRDYSLSTGKEQEDWCLGYDEAAEDAEARDLTEDDLLKRS